MKEVEVFHGGKDLEPPKVIFLVAQTSLGTPLEKFMRRITDALKASLMKTYPNPRPTLTRPTTARRRVPPLPVPPS